MVMKQAIILAGGFGTRLQSVLKDLPKPMAPVNGRPFLTYILDYLIDNSYTDVVLSVGYMHKKIEDFLGNCYKSINLEYAVENEPLGTGGAIAYALEKCSEDDVLVLNGDTLFKANLLHLEDFHKKNNSPLSIVLRHVDDTSRYGNVVVDENCRIIDFKEKRNSSGQGTINGGIYLIHNNIIKNFGLPKKFSFEKDLMEKFYMQQSFFGVESDGYFIDIGIPEDYLRAQGELK